MPKETLNTRVTTLEGFTKELAKAQIKLTNSMNHLADVQADMEETHAKHEAESRAREKRLDARIDKLVSAIGELISRMPANGGKR